MKKISFLSLSGIDGAGKTTIAKTISKKIEQKNSKPLIVKCGANIRFATFPLFLLFKMLGYVPSYGSGNKIHSSRYPEVFRFKLLSSLWTIAVLIDTFFIIFIRIKVPLFFGRVVISDRFVHDVIVELMIATKNDKIYETKFGFLFLKIAKPDIAFLVDIDEKIVFHRKDDVPSLDHLRIRRRFYLKLASNLENIIILNGNKSKEEINAIVGSYFE